ncbi:MAG: putative enoyl-CoA hydratase [Acidimicrobiia bacterium]|nr:putative enoyl-CoA hydratase [Acidimicrobiia bacterium]
MAQLLIDVTDRIATITLNDPDRRNAINSEMNEELVAAFDDLESRDDVGAVIITGAGKGFCAGADLNLLRDATEPAALTGIYTGFLRVANSNLPTVAAVNGASVGAGMNMALACDVILASTAARFDTRFLDIGLHPGGGNTWRLRRLTNHQTVLAMVLFGQQLTGAEAAARGLAWQCTEPDQLISTARAIAGRAAGFPRELTRRVKATIMGLDEVTDSQAAVEHEVQPQLWSMAQPQFQELIAKLQADIASR